MSNRAIRYLVASAFVLGTLFSPISMRAQTQCGGPGCGPPYRDLTGDWKRIGTSDEYVISIRRNGDVLPQGAPLAHMVEGPIKGGANFAFEGNDPQIGIFRCIYYITFLDGELRASFRLVEQTGDAVTCAQGIFERVPLN
jgi:hypothetical protein